MVDENEANNIYLYVSEYSIRQTVEAKYKKMFLDDYWNSKTYNLKWLFIARFDALKPEQILKELITRHHWLAEENEKISSRFSPSFNYTIAYKFLSPIIKNALYELEHPQQTPWTWSSVEELIKNKVQWSKIDVTELKAKIEGYPMSDIEDFYHSSSTNFHSVTDQFQHAMVYSSNTQSFSW
ncbi:MAG: hypothetical protein ACRCXC_02045 [Legionella sp.]